MDKPRLNQLCFEAGRRKEDNLFSDKIRLNLASQTELVIVRH